jgi:hypothetical protein
MSTPRTSDQDPAAWLAQEAEALAWHLRAPRPDAPLWEVAHTLSRIAALGEAYAKLCNPGPGGQIDRLKTRFAEVTAQASRSSSIFEQLDGPDEETDAYTTD